MVYKTGIISISGVQDVYPVIYQGQGISTNDYYAGASGKNGWKIRAGIKTKYCKIFVSLLYAADLPWMDKYIVILKYNSRMDPDNTIGGLAKLMLDSLKQERKEGVVVKQGWVYDDSKKYIKGIMAVPDEGLPNNTYIFDILHLK